MLNFGKLFGEYISYLVGKRQTVQTALFQDPLAKSEFLVEQKIQAKSEIATYSTDPSSTHAIELAERPNLGTLPNSSPFLWEVHNLCTWWLIVVVSN